MRILTHIHTFNDTDIIDRTIEAVRRQTRPVDGILVVDNACTDATLDQMSLRDVTVLREHENVGTSGAVITGMRYALEQNYDWIWILDANSFVQPDALKNRSGFANLNRGISGNSGFRVGPETVWQ